MAYRTVYEEIGDGAEILDINGREVSVRQYCSWFNFKGGDQQKAVSVLSGGERNRLLLAKVCMRVGKRASLLAIFQLLAVSLRVFLCCCAADGRYDSTSDHA